MRSGVCSAVVVGDVGGKAGVEMAGVSAGMTKVGVG